MRRTLGISAALVTAAVLGVTASIALAVGLSNPGEAERCATGSGNWHFVHNKTSATSGMLTVTLGGVTTTVPNTPSPSTNLHYNVTGSGPLTFAQDNVGDGKLVLSDCPEGTTTTTTTTTVTTTTTT